MEIASEYGDFTLVKYGDFTLVKYGEESGVKVQIHLYATKLSQNCPAE